MSPQNPDEDIEIVVKLALSSPIVDAPENGLRRFLKNSELAPHLAPACRFILQYEGFTGDMGNMTVVLKRATEVAYKAVGFCRQTLLKNVPKENYKEAKLLIFSIGIAILREVEWKLLPSIPGIFYSIHDGIEKYFQDLKTKGSESCTDGLNMKFFLETSQQKDGQTESEPIEVPGALLPFSDELIPAFLFIGEVFEDEFAFECTAMDFVEVFTNPVPGKQLRIRNEKKEEFIWFISELYRKKIIKSSQTRGYLKITSAIFRDEDYRPLYKNMRGKRANLQNADEKTCLVKPSVFQLIHRIEQKIQTLSNPSNEMKTKDDSHRTSGPNAIV